jgi:hypothetical protein
MHLMHLHEVVHRAPAPKWSATPLGNGVGVGADAQNPEHKG